MKKIFLLLFVFISFLGKAQDVAGYWYGTASVGSGTPNNYLVELIIKQNNNAIQGILNYYFRNTYRSVKINGNYNPTNRELSFYNLAVPYFGSTSENQVDCPMDFIATHRIAKAGSNLNGRFVGREGYKYTCPDIVFDLSLNKDAGNHDSILLALKNFKETYQVWSPSATDTLVAAVVQQRTIQNIVVNNEYKIRKTVIQKEIEVTSDSLQVDFYDNGEVDGDSIAVFFNEKLLAANLRLSTKSIHINLALDNTREINTIAMFANNLGSIPPNTALMVLMDGKKRYEISLSSNLLQNGAIRIRRKPK